MSLKAWVSPQAWALAHVLGLLPSRRLGPLLSDALGPHHPILPKEPGPMTDTK